MALTKEVNFLKNSNTGFLVKEVIFKSESIKNIPIYYYNIDGILITENAKLQWFVKISKKKFNRIKRKLNRSKNQ